NPSPAPRERVASAASRVRVVAVRETLTLPSLRDGSLPLPQCGRGANTETRMAYDLLIKNGRIVDGSGGPSYRGDVAVKDGKIVEIGKLSGPAARTIDAEGRVDRARGR